MKALTVGDVVWWRDWHGNGKKRKAKITGIDKVRPGERTGAEVKSMPWSELNCVVVDLDVGQWAYGYQISPVE